MRHNVLISALLAITLAILACASPLQTSTLVPAETGVALTLDAISAAATPPPTDMPTPLPTEVPDVLPHPLLS